jgi:hypothetical protein
LRKRLIYVIEHSTQKALRLSPEEPSAATLDANGNTLAVGVPSEAASAIGTNGNQTNNFAPDAGAAYLFIRNGQSWSQQAYIKASNTSANGLSSGSVALSGDGNTLAVGATGESSAATGINGNQADNSLTKAGAVYLY